ncbi:M48 family metalloprotease [Massilia sp. TSP1-1-2]|uniref:M48 family metalloprotease n=1 Tax=Massilia sp. TSP1-1-2 TaxID=2804649 RepID=UPI003CEC5107
MEATTYHADVCNYLSAREPDLWRWGALSTQDDLQQVRLHLLKTTYQLSLKAHPELHAAAARAAQALGITPAISLYQSNDGGFANVAVYTAPGEAHIIFQGAVLGMLNGAEIDAVLGHELAHYLLWQRDGQRYWIASRILERLALEESPPGVWASTAIRYQQYTEIYADRGAYALCRDIGPCVASLVKIQTGAPTVHLDSYLQQAERILAHDSVAGEQAGHPQNFIRTRALALHADGAEGIDAALALLLAGPLNLNRLDILDQLELHRLTRRVLAQLLAPAWFASDSVLALARRYYADFQPGEATANGACALPPGHQLSEFFSFVLLDFACVDPSLDDLPLAGALRMADHLGIGETFDALLLKETGIKKAALTKLKAARDDLLARATTSIAP